jgi:hypothetical protein
VRNAHGPVFRPNEQFSKPRMGNDVTLRPRTPQIQPLLAL